ncbi:MAG: Sapep family Mn(2+)-dependent dipeptidase [Synergistaceae bacterium]|jgi:succinyl-diaminopimelate desuccinylase|nr:Sapep family Mn(2+)-dependent dipeptidase [Synergistaceae bacterium]
MGDYEAIHRIIDEKFEDITQDLALLVRVPSVLNEAARTQEHPFGQNVSAALETFLNLGIKYGFATSNIDNMIGYAEIGSGPLFGVLVHLDVMPEGDASRWRYPPFEAAISDGKMYGRGTSDDKGPAISVLHALKALLDADIPLKRRFRVIAGLDEESGSRCIERYKSTEEIPKSSFSPDAMFPVVNGEKGVLHITLQKEIHVMDAMGLPNLVSICGGDRFNVVPDEVRVFFRHASAGNLEMAFIPVDGTVESTGNGVLVTVNGRAAHAMEPWKGENAIQKFLSVVESLDFGPPELHMGMIELNAMFKLENDGSSLGIACSDDVSGPLSCNLAAISLDDSVLSVKCDIRYPVKVNGDFVLDGLRHSADLMGWELDILHHSNPLFVHPGSELVTTLLDAYESVTGERPEPISIGGGTYCKSIPNAVSFGALFPGEEETAHQVNEYVPLDSLRRMTHIYAEAFVRFNEQI